MAKNEVTKKQSTEIAAPAMDFQADAGMGMEGVDKESLAIPFITLLQGLSPQLETVEGAKPGQFINTITNDVSEFVEVIPCAFQRRYLRWAPDRGGYKGDYSPIDVETNKVEGMSEHDGHYLVDVPEGVKKVFDENGRPLYDSLKDTRNHFVFYKTPAGTWKPALISLSSTQIKKSKRWMALVQGVEMTDAKGKVFNPPSFSHIYKITTVKEKNKKGEWWGYNITLEAPIEDANLYQAAKTFYQQVVSGEVEVAPPVEDVEADSTAEDDGKF